MRRGFSQGKIVLTVVLLTGVAVALLLLIPQEHNGDEAESTANSSERPRHDNRFVPPPEGAAEEPTGDTLAPQARGRTVRGWTLPPPREARRGNILDSGTQAATATDFPVTLVSVNFNRLPCDEACAALSKASKYGVDLLATSPRPEAGLPLVSLSLQNVPFMEALLQLRDQTNALAQASINDVAQKRVTLTFSQARGVGQWCVSGPFAMSTTSISRQVTTDFSQRDSYCRLSVDVMCEPLFAVYSVGQPEVEGMLDEHGTSISAVNLVKLPDLARTFSIYFRTPATSRRLAALKGKTLVRFMGGMQRIQSNSLTEATTCDLRGFRAEVLPRGDTLAVQVRFTRTDMPAELWKDLLPRFEEVIPSIVDTADTVMPRVLGPEGTTSSQESADQLLITYRVREPMRGRGAVPSRITMVVPSELREAHVPFEFKDLILP